MKDNHQVLSSFLQSWLNNHLANTSVIELGYSLYDIEKNRYLLISTNTAWRNQFLSHGLDKTIICLLQSDIFLLSSQSPIKQLYNQYHDESSCKTMFVFRCVTGFEIFEVTTPRELSYCDQSTVRLLLLNLSYKLNNFIADKINTPIYSKINHIDLVKAQYAQQPIYDMKPYSWALFQGDLVLTTKEQSFIEHLILNMTQKEIASRLQCSVKTVRKKQVSIKRKLGDSSMTTSAMMIELRKRGILSMFSLV